MSDDAEPAEAAFCPGCGRASAECAGCLWEYDPPHFCPRCGTRLAVNVSPTGWRARCREHGQIDRRQLR